MTLRDRLSSVFKSQDEFDLTSGDIGRPLLYLALPIVITNLLQTAYNLADTFWLGQFSTEALAAISFAFPMVFLLISLGMGISVAGSVLVAQHTGADEPEQAEYAASQTVTFGILGAAVLGGVGFLFVGEFLGLLGASPDVLPLATDYMRVIAAGLPFMFGFFVFIALMRGYGDTITPMLVMLGTVILNIVIDPILIFGFDSNPLFGIIGMRGLESGLFAATGYTGSGMAGAAYATVFSRAVALVVGLAIMFRGTRGVEIHLSDMAPDFSYARKIVRIGVPASIEGTGRSLSVNLMLVIVGLFPTAVVAGYGIGVRVFSVIFLPAIAVARGVETMTGQNIGAGKPDRGAEAARLAAIVTFGVLSGAGVVVWLAAAPIANVFTDDPQVISVTEDFLRWVAPTFGFIGVMRSYTGSFRGAGKTLTAAVISILMLGFIRLPLAYAAVRPPAFLAIDSLGSSGIWLSFAVSNVAGALMAYAWYQRGTWRDADPRGSGPTVDDDAEHSTAPTDDD
ncbi:MATE family efflux transporter [Candidatus Halobonum tyrrellensis]|uniref:Efflux protein, MATE family n=1 Tax=Candidatus Halobonum tyrrellensis G22 TaxID=1324957 RepID=V4H963_9EURY|nr:MATE family efflux transporter [Candidatus Halobonum tyrrellensis]ESP87255.1 efflux protein, MATE family [Candidatus Halobonum tyrrellensis G22]